MKTSNGTENTDGSALYEEAIALTSYGKFNYIVTIVGGFALMTSLLATVDVTYILPASECELKLEKKDRGILSGAYFIGVVVSSHILGFLSDTIGRRYILIRSLFGNIIIYIFSSFSPNYWVFLVMRFLTGIVLCGVLTCGIVYVGEFHSSKHRAKAVMINMSLATTAFIYCACLGWLILPNNLSFSLFGIFKFTPWRIYYVLLGGLPSTTIGLIIYFLPESPKYLLAVGKNTEALEILKTIYKFNTGKPKEEYPVKHLLQNPNEQVYKLSEPSKSVEAVMCLLWNQTYPLFVPPHILNMFFSCFILFTMFFSFSGILIWIPDITNQLLILKDDATYEPQPFCQIVQSNWTANEERINRLEPLNHTTIATFTDGNICKNTLKTSMFMLNTLIGFVLMICTLIASFLIAKLNRKAFVSIMCFSIIGTYVVLLEVPNIYVMIVCLGGSVILLNIIFCGTTTLLVDYFPTNYRAMAVCLAIMSGRLGSAVGGHVFSLFLLGDCKNMFYISAGLLLFGGISCISLRSPKTNIVTAITKVVN